MWRNNFQHLHKEEMQRGAGRSKCFEILEIAHVFAFPHTERVIKLGTKKFPFSPLKQQNFV